jgi:hypothetical protein
MGRIRLLLVFASAFAASTARGQAVASNEPSSSHIFPAGGRRGTVVPVHVGAECLPPGARFTLWGKGVRASAVLGPRAHARTEPSARRLPLDANFITYPKEWESEISIAADAAIGPCFWRVTCGWGGTQVRPFLVGDLPEHIEQEPNSSPGLAEKVALPIVLNGQIAGERDIDYYTFAARAGETIVCDAMARRIGSPLDPVLELRDARGHRLTGDEVRVGDDPVLGYRIPADGEYSLMVANLGFGGGPEYVYRITVSSAAYIYSAFPTGGRSGESREIEFLALTGVGAPQVLKERVSFPTRAEGLFWYRSIAASNLVLFSVGHGPELTEPGTNQSAATATDVSPPVTVNGRFKTDSAEDWFRLAAKRGEIISIDCRPFPPGSPAMPLFTIEDEKGIVLARGSGVEAPGHRSSLEWQAPGDGIYRLRLRDLQYGSRGGPDFVYRLTLRRGEQDFTVSLAKDSINVTQGSKQELDVIVTRNGGFSGPVLLDVSGLPPGVRTENTTVPENVQKQRIALVAAKDARPTDAVLRVMATAKIAGKTLERIATVIPLGFDSEGASPAAPALRDLRLTVAHRPLFRLTCSEAYQYAHRGTIYPYRMQVERLEGFDEEIHIQICDRQVQDLDGIEVIEQVIPRGAKEFDNLIYFPESMHASVQHHSRPYIQGYACFKDQWGQQQTLLSVADHRCMVRTRPAIARLRPAAGQVTARAGTAIECKLVLDRTSNFSGAVRIQLIEPPPGVALRPGQYEIPANSDEVTLQVSLGRETNPTAIPALKFRASGRMESGATVVTEAVVDLKWE